MKILVRLVLCFMISFSLAEFPIMKAQAHAGMISTSEVVTDITRADAEKTLNAFLDRNDVKEQMVKLGVNPEEANRRLASLSDSEARKLAGDIDKATAGGNIGGILVLVLVIILIIYFARRI